MVWCKYKIYNMTTLVFTSTQQIQNFNITTSHYREFVSQNKLCSLRCHHQMSEIQPIRHKKSKFNSESKSCLIRPFNSISCFWEFPCRTHRVYLIVAQYFAALLAFSDRFIQAINNKVYGWCWSRGVSFMFVVVKPTSCSHRHSSSLCHGPCSPWFDLKLHLKA